MDAWIIVLAIIGGMLVGAGVVFALMHAATRSARKLLERVWWSNTLPKNSQLEQDVYDVLYQWGGE